MLLEKNGRRSPTKNTRHMEIRYFFITDHVKRNKMSIEYCPTDDMLGDYFTKPTQGLKFRRFQEKIMNLNKSCGPAAQECVGEHSAKSSDPEETGLEPIPKSSVTRVGSEKSSSSRKSQSEPRTYCSVVKQCLNRVSNKLTLLRQLK